MYALVEKNQLVKVINNPINVKMLNGDFITDIRLLSFESKRILGLYDYIIKNKAESYQKVISFTIQIDNENAIVYVEFTFEDLDISIKKQDLINSITITANEKLRSCDHCVIESMELGKALDVNVKNYRSNIRKCLADAIQNINSIDNHNELLSFNVNWPNNSSWV